MHIDTRDRWVLAMADSNAALTLAERLSANVHVSVASNGDEALLLVQRTMPEVLITDLTLAGCDGPELIRRVRTTRLFTLPYAVMLVIPEMAHCLGQFSDIGTCMTLVKPIDAQALLASTQSLTPCDRLSREGVDSQQIQGALWTLGFYARMQGTRYLSTAIDLASRDVRLNKQLTTVLYPLVAKVHGIEQKRVEHAMRRAIESAWSSGSLEAQYRLFGNTIDARRGKPTIGEMIACIAELLRTGMEMNQ